MGVRKFAGIAFDPAKDRPDVAEHGLSRLAEEGFDPDTALEREGDRLKVLVFAEDSRADAVRAIGPHPAKKHAVRFWHGQA